MTSEIRLLTWNINQFSGVEQGVPCDTDVEAGVLKVIDDFLDHDGPAIVALQEVPSEGGYGYKPNPEFIDYLTKQMGCDVVYDTLDGGFRSFHKVVAACRNVGVESHTEIPGVKSRVEIPKAWRRNLQNRYVPFRVTLDGRKVSMLALHASGTDGLHDAVDHLGSWNELDSERVVVVGDFNANGEGRKAIKRFVDAHPEGLTRVDPRYPERLHSPDTVMYRGVSVEDVAVNCECDCSDHFPLTCTVQL